MVATENEREALLIDAFYLSDSRLFYGINRTGEATVFTSLLIKKLIDHGGHVEGAQRRQILLAIAGALG